MENEPRLYILKSDRGNTAFYTQGNTILHPQTMTPWSDEERAEYKLASYINSRINTLEPPRAGETVLIIPSMTNANVVPQVLGIYDPKKENVLAKLKEQNASLSDKPTLEHLL